MPGRKHQPLDIESDTNIALLQKRLFVQLATSCTLTSKGIPEKISRIRSILKGLIQNPIIRTVSSHYFTLCIVFIE